MSQDIIPVLNHLIEVCRNGEHGFREAAEGVEDAHLTSVLMDFSAQREQFAKQLQYQVSLLGGRPENRGTFAGALHRRWIDVRSALSTRSASVILAECHRGEAMALEAYEEALRKPFPEEIHGLIEQQHLQVRAAYETVRGLELKVNGEPAF
jgi:uncharacterized protein (TIGR02284 family)